MLGKSGCRECSKIDNSGKNHYNWKGGESEVIDILRKSIKEWKKEVLLRDDFKCWITDSKKDLIVHHLKSFNTILNEASLNTGIPVLRKLSDYHNIEDFYILQKELIKLHTIECGITLTREIHNKFHSLYGKGNNTPEQFEEFFLLYDKR